MQFIEQIKYFENILNSATKERNKRKFFIPDKLNPKREELAWVSYERFIMFLSVNMERIKFGKRIIKLDKIMSAENKAFGHSDYVHKFALYCSELVLES